MHLSNKKLFNWSVANKTQPKALSSSCPSGISGLNPIFSHNDIIVLQSSFDNTFVIQKAFGTEGTSILWD